MSEHNYPDTIRLGDATEVSYQDGVLQSELGSWKTKIDLIIGGSPCQDFSSLRVMGQHGKQSLGLSGSKSSLFYEYLRILKEVQSYRRTFHQTKTIH